VKRGILIPSRWSGGDNWQIDPALIGLAAVVEFLCLRFLIRLGPLIPRSEIVAAVNNALITSGIVALNLAILLMVIFLAREAFAVPHRVQQIALGATSALAIFLSVTAYAAGWFVAFLLCALAAMFLRLPPSRSARLWCALVVAVYPLLTYTTISGSLQLALPFTPHAFALAELGAVIAAASAPFALRVRFDRRAAISAVIGMSLLTGMWLSVAWLPGTLMIWTLGLTAYLPGIIYIVAGGAFVYTLIALAFARDARAWGLWFIACAGLRWDYTYSVLLAVMGVWALAQTDRLHPAPLPDSTRVRSNLS
jgi:hypothetical protein